MSRVERSGETGEIIYEAATRTGSAVLRLAGADQEIWRVQQRLATEATRSQDEIPDFTLPSLVASRAINLAELGLEIEALEDYIAEKEFEVNQAVVGNSVTIRPTSDHDRPFSLRHIYHAPDGDVLTGEVPLLEKQIKGRIARVDLHSSQIHIKPQGSLRLSRDVIGYKGKLFGVCFRRKLEINDRSPSWRDGPDFGAEDRNS